MRNAQTFWSPRICIEACNSIFLNWIIQHFAKPLHDKNKEKRGEMISLSQSSLNRKRLMESSSNKHLELHWRDIKANPVRLNPICLSKSDKKLQLTWSKAFSMSNLQIIPGIPDFNLESKHSLAIRVASLIFLSLRKAIWEVLTNLWSTTFSLSARALAIIL